ncbi:hypothetical protein HYQ44_003617 [Verticillium longisporum]|nr:hypothetical protein HYQ44_003617 [Verticillium longisporum]
MAGPLQVRISGPKYAPQFPHFGVHLSVNLRCSPDLTRPYPPLCAHLSIFLTGPPTSSQPLARSSLPPQRPRLNSVLPAPISAHAKLSRFFVSTHREHRLRSVPHVSIIICRSIHLSTRSNRPRALSLSCLRLSSFQSILFFFPSAAQFASRLATINDSITTA